MGNLVNNFIILRMSVMQVCLPRVTGSSRYWWRRVTYTGTLHTVTSSLSRPSCSCMSCVTSSLTLRWHWGQEVAVLSTATPSHWCCVVTSTLCLIQVNIQPMLTNEFIYVLAYTVEVLIRLMQLSSCLHCYFLQNGWKYLTSNKVDSSQSLISFNYIWLHT